MRVDLEAPPGTPSDYRDERNSDCIQVSASDIVSFSSINFYDYYYKNHFVDLFLYSISDGLDMVLCQLGVLGVGAAFVPIDPSAPLDV